MLTKFLTLNPFSTDPLYRQLKGVFKDAILHGQIAQHEPLPTMVELMDRFGISSTVVNKAYSQLEKEGMIYRIRGKGTFVSYLHKSYVELPMELSQLIFFQDDSQFLTGIILKERDEQFDALKDAKQIIRFNRVFTIKGVPAYQEIFMPSIARNILEKIIDQKTFFKEFLKQKLNQVKQSSIHHHHAFTTSSPSLEQYLELTQTTPLHIVTSTLRFDHNFVLVIRTYFHGQRIVFKFGIPL
jgi:DNA-binding GntR family transcriptional regulator